MSSFVQNNQNHGVQSITFLSAVNKGDFILVAVYSGTVGGDPGAVTDNQGSTYTLLKSQSSAPNRVDVWAGIAAAAAGAGTFTISTATLGTNQVLWIAEYELIADTLDAFDLAVGTGTATKALTMNAPTGDALFVVVGGVSGTDPALTFDGGFAGSDYWTNTPFLGVAANLLGGVAPQAVNVGNSTSGGDTNFLYFELAFPNLPPVTLTPAAGSLPSGAFNAGYIETITATGGNGGPYTFAVTSGALPSGLALNANGVLSGIPHAVGSFSFTVTATDPKGVTGSAAYTLAISASPTPSLSVLQANLRSIPPAYPSTCLKEGRKIAQYFLNPSNFAQVSVIPSLPNFTGNHIGEFDIVTGSGQTASFSALQGVMVCALHLTTTQFLIIDTGDGVPIIFTPDIVFQNVFGRIPIYTAPGNLVKVYLVDTSGSYAPNPNCEINVSVTNFIPDTTSTQQGLSSAPAPPPIL